MFLPPSPTLSRASLLQIDLLTVLSDATTEGGVLAPATVVSHGTGGGAVTFPTPHVALYTPDTDFAGVDTFRVRVCDVLPPACVGTTSPRCIVVSNEVTVAPSGDDIVGTTLDVTIAEYVLRVDAGEGVGLPWFGKLVLPWWRDTMIADFRL